MELIVKVIHPDYDLFLSTNPTEPLPDNQIALRGKDRPVTLEARNWGSVGSYRIRIESARLKTRARVVLENALDHPFNNTVVRAGNEVNFGNIAQFTGINVPLSTRFKELFHIFQPRDQEG